MICKVFMNFLITQILLKRDQSLGMENQRKLKRKGISRIELY